MIFEPTTFRMRKRQRFTCGDRPIDLAVLKFYNLVIFLKFRNFENILVLKWSTKNYELNAINNLGVTINAAKRIA